MNMKKITITITVSAVLLMSLDLSHAMQAERPSTPPAENKENILSPFNTPKVKKLLSELGITPREPIAPLIFNMEALTRPTRVGITAQTTQHDALMVLRTGEPLSIEEYDHCLRLFAGTSHYGLVWNRIKTDPALFAAYSKYQKDKMAEQARCLVIERIPARQVFSLCLHYLEYLTGEQLGAFLDRFDDSSKRCFQMVIDHGGLGGQLVQQKINEYREQQQGQELDVKLCSLINLFQTLEPDSEEEQAFYTELNYMTGEDIAFLLERLKSNKKAHRIALKLIAEEPLLQSKVNQYLRNRVTEEKA